MMTVRPYGNNCSTLQTVLCTMLKGIYFTIIYALSASTLFKVYTLFDIMFSEDRV